MTMSSNEGLAESAGQKKVDEYVERIKSGESKEEILEGLSESFKQGIERGLVEPTEDMRLDDQQEGQRQNLERIEDVRSRLLPPKEAIESLHPPLPEEERRKLSGWQASYELANIALQEGVDLLSLSREDYAQYAIQNFLAIDDSQLRAAPYQRTALSAEEVIRANKERKADIKEEVDAEFNRFSFDVMHRAATENRSLGEGIRIRQGTKDSNSWLFFGINEGTGESRPETYKSYLSLMDLNKLSPQRFTTFMEALRDAQYNGDIKIFQDLSEQGIKLNDQIVMHGRSEADAVLALQVAEDFFKDELGHKSSGKDETVNGKKFSYSQVLSGQIAEAIRSTARR